MSEIAGVGITEVTAFGCSDDGLQVWITHKLRDGSEYRLVYPSTAAGHLITLFTHAARLAHARRAGRNPQAAADGMNSDVIPIEEVRIEASPDGSGAILHLTTADDIPVAVEMTKPLLEAMVEQLRSVLTNLGSSATTTGRIH